MHMNMNNLMKLKSEYKIFTKLRGLIIKVRPLTDPLLTGAGLFRRIQVPDLKELSKQNFLPLASKYRYREDSLLTKTSTAYLYSLHPNQLRVNIKDAPSTQVKVLNENEAPFTKVTFLKDGPFTKLTYISDAPSTQVKVLNEKEAPSTQVKVLNEKDAPSTQVKVINGKDASSLTSDVIYEYLKTFSKYLKRKTGLLIKNNQHIAYNFNSKKILKRGDEALINKSLKKLKNLKLKLKLKTNNKNLCPVVETGKARENHLSLLGSASVASVAFAKWKANAQGSVGNIIEPLNKGLLGLKPESSKNSPKAPFARTARTVEKVAPQLLAPNTGAAPSFAFAKWKANDTDTEIDQDLTLRLHKINSLSPKTGNILKENNRLIKYSYKLLFYFFKSMYCLISKPVFLFTPEKVVIQLNYFLVIPKYEVFNWYSILKYKQIRHNWETKIKEKQNKHRERMEMGKFNLHSDAELARKLNHNDKVSSNQRFDYDKFKKMMFKVNRKVKITLNRLKNKRDLVQKNLFNLNKYNLFRVFSPKFKLICEILNKKFKKPVEFQLIRIHQPFKDSNVLVNLLSLNIRNRNRNKNFNTNVQIQKLFQKSSIKNVFDFQNKSVNFIPAYLSGIQISIGGRLMRDSLDHRTSKKIYERGARSIGKVNYLDTASITNKNRKGSYTLKITSGQNFF